MFKTHDAAAVAMLGSALACLAAVTVPLACIAAPGEWMPEARPIANIVVEGDAGGVATIIIRGGVQPDYIPPACNSPYNTVDLSTSKGRGQLALLLSAYASDRPVKLALSCIGDRPLVTHVML